MAIIKNNLFSDWYDRHCESSDCELSIRERLELAFNAGVASASTKLDGEILACLEYIDKNSSSQSPWVNVRLFDKAFLELLNKTQLIMYAPGGTPQARLTPVGYSSMQSYRSRKSS